MDDLTDILEHLIDDSRLPAQPSMEQLKERADRRSQRRLPNRSVVLVPLVGIAAAALVVVLVLQLLPASGQHPTSAAAAVLNEAASVAANLPASQVPGPGQYLYYRTSGGEVVPSGGAAGTRQYLFVTTETTETWVAPNGSGRQRVDAAAHLLYPSDQSAWEAAGSPNYDYLLPGIYDNTFPIRSLPVGATAILGADGEYHLPYPAGSHLPTDPTALKQYLNRYDNNSGPTTAFLTASTIFEEGASPALRSALFQVIEQIPGVTLVGPTKDEAGRSGLGVALDSKSSFYMGSAKRYIFVFNPKTSEVLGIKILMGPAGSIGGAPVPEGTLIGFTNFGPTAVVSSTSVVPH